MLNTVSGNQIGAGKQVSLEQSFVVFRLPENGKERRLRRRVDIIFAPWEVYWSAVLGWSGSQQFERDLRYDFFLPHPQTFLFISPTPG